MGYLRTAGRKGGGVQVNPLWIRHCKDLTQLSYGMSRIPYGKLTQNSCVNLDQVYIEN